MALYAQFQVESEFMGRDVRITGGLRYEDTEVTSKALQAVPTNILWTADNDFLIQFGNELQTVEGEGDYSHVLPNLDIRVERHRRGRDTHVLQPDDWSRAVRRPVRVDHARCAEPPDSARWPDRWQLAESGAAAARVGEL